MTIDGAWSDFIALVQDVWQNGIFSLDIGEFLIAFAIFSVFFLLRNLLTRFVIRKITKIVSKTENLVDDAVVRSLEAPIRFIPIVMGIFFGLYYMELEGTSAEIAAMINRSLVAFTIFWALYRAAEPITALFNMASHFLTEPMVEWLGKISRAMFIVIGAATILELWGIEVGPLIAGLGLFGVAVALGAQDLFKNLIAGLFVIGERRFNPGDWILVEGVVEGTVAKIGFRTTTVIRFDKAPVYVPNAKLSDNSVTNFSRMTFRRIKWVIGIEYSATSEQLQKIRDGIEDYITDNPDFAKPSDTATFVRIDGFAGSSIDILLYCFTNTTNWLEWMAIKEKLLLSIKATVEGAGTGFAFPSRSIYIEALPGDMEAMPPSQEKLITSATQSET